MKKNILFTAVFLANTVVYAQPHVAMYLRDAKGNPIKSQDVNNIALFVLAPDSVREIHFERFDLFSIHDGLVYLEIGHGTTSVDYYTAVNRYFNSFPIENRPEAGTNLVVKIEARLANGSLISGYQTLYVNSSDPLIKGSGDQTTYLSGNEFFMHNGNQFSYVQPGNLKFSTPGFNSELDATKGLILKDEKTKTTSWFTPTSLSIDEEAIRVWHIWNKGFEYNPEAEKQVFLNKDGLFLNELKNNYKFSLGYNKLSLGQNNTGWELTPSGGSFKFTNDKSINFNNNMIDVADSLSKRSSRMVPNGLINLFDNKSIMGLGVTTLGNPQVIFNRSNGIISYSSAINDDGGMDQSFYNKNGNVTFRSTTLSGTDGDNPYVYITKDGGAPGAGMFYSSQGVATLFATVKNFRMDHPDSKDEDIVYASLEGPEAAAYCRGTGQLEKGKAIIRFPDHYKYVCDPELSTIQLTPKSAESEGLAVIAVTTEGFQIVELHKGLGDYEFYWEAKSIRKGFENYQVIRPKADLAPAELKAGSLLKN